MGETELKIMSDLIIEGLILDLLEWVAKQERTYKETMDAWRTSCPKLPVWEEARDRELIEVDAVAGVNVVRITRVGRALLESIGSRSVLIAHETEEEGAPQC